MKESTLLNKNIVLSVSFKRSNDGCLSRMSLVICYNDHNKIRNGSRSQFG